MDDFGEDFVREMLKADAIEDNGMLCCQVKPAETPSTSAQLDVLPTAPSRIASIFSACSSKKAKSQKTGSSLKKASKLDKSAEQRQGTHAAGTCAVSTVLQQPKHAQMAHVLNTAYAFTAIKEDADMGQVPHAVDGRIQALEVGKETSKKNSNVAKTNSSHTTAKTSRHARKNKFMVNICKLDRQKLRLYLKKGHADDAVFDKLARRWHNYNASKRLAKLQTLLLPPGIFQCCDGDTQLCLCDKAAAARFFAKVCDKTSLQCAMLFLSQQRNHEYTHGLPPPTHKNGTVSQKQCLNRRLFNKKAPFCHSTPTWRGHRVFSGRGNIRVVCDERICQDQSVSLQHRPRRLYCVHIGIDTHTQKWHCAAAKKC